MSKWMIVKWMIAVASVALILSPLPCLAQTDGIYNVKIYGAQGDGSSDDSVAITAALAAAAPVKGTVFFPPGTYLISRPITPSADVTVAGAGRRSSMIKAGSGFRQNGNGLIQIVAPANRVIVRDLGFIANGAIVGVYMESVSDAQVQRCWFDADFWWACFIGTSSKYCKIVDIISEGTTAAHNVEINDSSYCEVSGSHLKDAFHSGVELYLKTPGELVGNRVINNTIEGAKSGGIHVEGDRATIISGNVVRGSLDNGLFIAHSEVLGLQYPSIGGQAVGNSFLDSGGNSQNGVVFAGGNTQGWVFKGNTVRGSGNVGIYVTGTGHSIEGNTISENGRHGIYLMSGVHTVANNSCVNNSTLGQTAGDGIRVETSGSSLWGNVSLDTRVVRLQTWGIMLIGGTSNNTLGGNVTGGMLADLGVNNTKTANK
jgi:parallel beta-helix repeat protein